jgi:hypothetical protein
MANVRLQFTLPVDPDVTTLVIWEAAAATGPWTKIDETSAIGSFPTYVNYYTTTLAQDANNWFAISWKTSAGVESDISEPMQGGSDTLVGKVVDRVLQRDPSINAGIATQEAEVVIERYYLTDPYLVDPGVSYATLNGLVYLTLARCLFSKFVSTSTSQVNRVTIGLLTMQGGSSTASAAAPLDIIKQLVDAANAELGLTNSYVMLLEEPEWLATCQNMIPPVPPLESTQ